MRSSKSVTPTGRPTPITTEVGYLRSSEACSTSLRGRCVARTAAAMPDAATRVLSSAVGQRCA